MGADIEALGTDVRARTGISIWTILGPFWDDFGPFLGPFLDHFGPFWRGGLDHFGQFWDHFGTILGPFVLQGPSIQESTDSPNALTNFAGPGCETLQGVDRGPTKEWVDIRASAQFLEPVYPDQ